MGLAHHSPSWQTAEACQWLVTQTACWCLLVTSGSPPPPECWHHGSSEECRRHGCWWLHSPRRLCAVGTADTSTGSECWDSCHTESGHFSFLLRYFIQSQPRTTSNQSESCSDHMFTLKSLWILCNKEQNKHQPSRQAVPYCTMLKKLHFWLLSDIHFGMSAVNKDKLHATNMWLGTRQYVWMFSLTLSQSESSTGWLIKILLQGSQKKCCCFLVF